MRCNLRLLAICICLAGWKANANDSFYPPQPAAATAINFDGRGFLIKGQRTFIASGSIHYPRVPQALWRDRLLRLKRAGLNCVQTYAFMNYHSDQEGQYDFSGEKDFNLFLQQANDLGLYATVRPGMYVCAEWENGGYPNWLLQKPGLALRQNNAPFLAANDEWYAHVLPIVAANQINRGGSVILVQLENEHDSLWGTDTSVPPQAYFEHIRTNALSHGIEVPTFFSGVHHASDPAGNTSWDSIGRNTPWFSTEYWAGWYNQFGDNVGQAKGMDRINWKMLAYGGNGYNYYMFHGGSNFDHWNNDEDAASYDYGAALGQCGDLRTLYYRDKRAALFARSFQAILENSTNSTSSHSGVASGISAITARSSSSGTIIFLDNNTDGTVTATLTNGAQIKLEAREIVPVVRNFALASWLTIKESDARILGVQTNANFTTLVLYGLSGENVRVTLDTATAPSSADSAFALNGTNVIFSTTVPSGSPTSHWLVGNGYLRVAVMSKTMADRTWFVDSAGTNYVVSGPAYVGEFTNSNGQISCTLEEPMGSMLPTNILVYGAAYAQARSLTITNQIEGSALTAPILENWQMRLANGSSDPNYDDSSWLARTPPALMGADGDSSAYAWYRTQIQAPNSGNYTLTFTRGIGDWGMLFVNGQKVAMQPANQSFSVQVTLQAGANTLALFTSHYGRSKLFGVYGSSDNTFTPKGLLGTVSISEQTTSTVSLTNWNWKTVGSTAPSAASILQMTATNLDPLANGWSTGESWNGDMFNQTAGYAWFRIALPAMASTGRTVHFANVDDNAIVYLNGNNLLATHNGWGQAFDVALDGFWQTNGTNILTVLVQNTGNAGGINGVVTLSAQGAFIGTWKMQGGLGQIDGPGVVWQPLNASSGLPVFYRAEFQYQPPSGIQRIYRVTFGSLSHGFVWLNGHNLVRYPELISVNGIYLPECWLNPGTNALVIFDEQGKTPSEVILQVDTAASRQILQCADVSGSLAYAPATLKAIAGNAQVSVSWSAVPGATSYNVRRAIMSGGPYSVVTNLTVLSWTNTGLVNGTRYYYVVSGKNSSVETPYSAEESAMPNPPPPSAPSGLSGKGSDSQAKLSWTPVANATGYNVKRSSITGGPYITIATNLPTVTFTNGGLSNGWLYYYVVSALNAYAESSNSAEISVAQLPLGTLSGTVIGSSGTYGSGNTINKAFDGDLSSFYDAANDSGDWAGLDLGTSNIITAISYCPRVDFSHRMVGGMFQGDNNADFNTPVTLFTITAQPPQWAMTKQSIANTNSFRYVRYVGPASASCNVAEVQFQGYAPFLSPPSRLVALPGNGRVTLSWTPSSGAASYNLKRATANAAPYTTVANPTDPNYVDNGLANGTTYYYVVSAVNAGGGESVNSAASSATPNANITLYDTTLLAFDPMGYWKLDDVSDTTALDSSTSGLNGTYGAGVTLGASGPNPPFVGFIDSDNAARFQGLTTSYVALPVLNLNSANVTFTAWIYPTAATQGRNAGLIFCRDETSTNTSGFCYTDDGKNLQYQWNDVGDLWHYDSLLSPPINQWSFVALSVTPDHATIYLYNTNGQVSTVKTLAHLPATFNGTVRIGSDSKADGVRCFTGRICQAAVFNYSLTEAQIRQLYNVGANGTRTTSMFVERSGTSINLTWSMGTLLESTSVTGPWKTNSNTSPYTVPTTAPLKFYRLQLQ